MSGLDLFADLALLVLLLTAVAVALLMNGT